MLPKVILGPNGSGKTGIVEQMARRYRLEHSWDYVCYLTFRDSYGLSEGEYYAQQRWNSSEYELVPTVAETLGDYVRSDLLRRLFDMFDIGSMLPKPIIQLSSGELRKYLLVKALMKNPRVIFLDSPFIGLDTAARSQLDELILSLSATDEYEIYLVLSRDQDIPSYAGEVMRVGTVPEPSSTKDSACAAVAALPDFNPEYENALILRDVSIRFGNTTILDNVNWTVKAGEKWALKGPNGSGKSTLLSIVCADIPQAYACDVTLFDRRRGTGESIWDIKKHIGFVSPELHRAYCRNVPVIDVVASGLHDRKGLYVKTDESHIPDCQFWLDVFGISHLKDRSFMEISSGEQRLALLARAFVKDPELIILDEPLHGLDTANCERVRGIIEAFCSRKGKTMIMVSHYDEDFTPCITDSFTLNCLKNSGQKS